MESGASGISQLILLADLQTPTFKKSLIRAEQVLHTYVRDSEYEHFLRLLGSQGTTKQSASLCFENCMASYGKAVEIYKTGFFGDRNIKKELRPYLFRLHGPTRYQRQ